MRIFVTGASGWIGSAATSELLAAGHEVVGLARSDESAAAVEQLGAAVYRGSLDDPADLAEAAAASDGIVHLGYHHDFSQMKQAAATDLAAIEAMGAALAGSERPLLIASGTLGLAVGRVATERDDADSSAHPRIANAHATLALAERGVRSIVCRFAPTVHGAGDLGFVPYLVGVARTKGVSAYIGDGTNRWPAVHRLDAGKLVALAVEKAPAASVIHAVAEDGVPAREIAEAIGRGLDVPVDSIAAEDAPAHFGWMAGFFGADAPASSELTQELLGWAPTQQSLIADLDEGHYFG